MPAGIRKIDVQAGTCLEPKSPKGQSNMTDVLYSPDVFINGENAVRKDDQGNTKCGYGGVYRVTAGAGSVTINGKPAARLGDPTECMKCKGKGSLTAGSPDVNVE